MLETASALMISMVNTRRWIQDFLQHVIREFGSFYVAASYLQCSSIMPQKLNPVSIEHSRSIACIAYGDTLAAFNMFHNTPFDWEAGRKIPASFLYFLDLKEE